MDLTQIHDTEIITHEKFLKESDDNKIIDPFTFCQESFALALKDSLFNSRNRRPLAIYINDTQSLITDIFNTLFISSESIAAYLDENFLLWKWNRTEENYYELLTILTTHAGEEVATVIDSLPVEHYPVLVCLVFHEQGIKVECVIQNVLSEDEILALLFQTRDAFSGHIELPNTSGLNLRNISNEDWSIAESVITQVSKESAEFQRVVADFNNEISSIIRIDRIDNMIWLAQYLNQKSIVDARLEHYNTEKLLFHGCPYGAAELILQQAFDHNRIGRNGTIYGHGFYFSSSWTVSNRYAVPNPSTGEKRMLMCRVLVGRSCKGDSTTKTCPLHYDSTSNESDIYVVYTNRHILPEYLVTYK